jgi:hypothetical protein
LRRYLSSERYQVCSVVVQNGRDRLVGTAAVGGNLNTAIAAARSRQKLHGGVFVVLDRRPLKRSAGYVQRETIVFDTLTGETHANEVVA